MNPFKPQYRVVLLSNGKYVVEERHWWSLWIWGSNYGYLPATKFNTKQEAKKYCAELSKINRPLRRVSVIE